MALDRVAVLGAIGPEVVGTAGAWGSGAWASGRATTASPVALAGYTRAAVEVHTGLGLGVHSGRAVGAVGAVPHTFADLDEVSLVAALARGEAQALEELYERHSRGVFSLALHLLADRGAAEEVVQETFVKLWRRPDAYQPHRGRLAPWLLGVAHHRCVDLLRRRQLEQRHRAPAPDAGLDGADGLEAMHQQDGADGDPAARAGAIEQRQVVAEALSSLPQAQRVPIEMAYYQGLTQSEIAALLHEPLGTIKTRMRLGLQRLRAAPGLVEAWDDRG